MFVVSFCVTGLMNLNDHSAGMLVHVAFFPVKLALCRFSGLSMVLAITRQNMIGWSSEGGDVWNCQSLVRLLI